MPRFAVFALNQASNWFINAGFFPGERVEDSINAVELERVWHLVRKGDDAVVHGMS